MNIKEKRSRNLRIYSHTLCLTLTSNVCRKRFSVRISMQEYWIPQRCGVQLQAVKPR